MYPIRLGYDNALKRINKLIDNEHYAESFVTAVFTIEKTLRRTFRQLVVSSGFKSSLAEKIVKQSNGLHKLIDNWELYDPNHNKFSNIVTSEDITTIKEAATIRNKLIHGEKVYNVKIYIEQTQKVLISLEKIKNSFEIEYGYNGWKTAKGRKISKLHIDPKVKKK